MRKKEKKGGEGGRRYKKIYESVFARTCKFKIIKLVLITTKFMHFTVLVLFVVVVLIVMIFCLG